MIKLDTDSRWVNELNIPVWLSIYSSFCFQIVNNAMQHQNQQKISHTLKCNDDGNRRANGEYVSTEHLSNWAELQFALIEESNGTLEIFVLDDFERPKKKKLE